MVFDTPLSYRSLVLYSIYVRNHSTEGTFSAVEEDLQRIASLGVDIIWLMPIHPIGQVNRKGRLGSPYSIADYRAINPEYGTLEDFIRLINQAHQLGMKVMIDVVYNHTAHDSNLVKEHPEWFHQNAEGMPYSTVPDWSDVIDLKHRLSNGKGGYMLNEDLAKYLIESLQYWAKLGVDGFRCDVASLVPLDFWLRARQAVAQVRPGVIWLAETVHASFVGYRRAHGLPTHSDGEMYQTFDITYDYDIWPSFQQAVQGTIPVKRYLELLRLQDAIYPENFVKLRCVENHDQRRIMSLAPTPSQALAWTAFQAFNRGAFLIYAGQESAARRTPSLFDRDQIEWDNYVLQAFLSKLCALKKDPAMQQGNFILFNDEPAITAGWQSTAHSLFGVFNVSSAAGEITVPLPDGNYDDLLNGDTISVQNARLTIPDSAAILRCDCDLPDKPFYAESLDFHLDPNEKVNKE